MYILALAASGSAGREPIAIGAAILVFIIGMAFTVMAKRRKTPKSQSAVRKSRSKVND